MKNPSQQSESILSRLIARPAIRLWSVLQWKLAVFLGVALVLLLPTKGQAEEDATYYIYHGEKQSLKLDAAAVAVKLSESAANALVTARRIPPSLAAAGFTSVNVVAQPLPGWFVLDAKHAKASQAAAAAQIHELIRSVLDSNDSSVEFVSPVFRDDQGGPILITSRLLLGFQKGFSDQDRARLRATIPEGAEVEAIEFPQPNEERWLIYSRDGLDVLARANALAGTPGITYAEPDMIISAYSDLVPNDPSFSQSWGLRNTGQLGGLAGFDMGATSAWDITTGSSSVIAIILDNGVQQDHPDINQVPGRDFTTDAPSNPNGGPVTVFDNHGTAVAGCISERINNFIGSAGIAPGVKIASARFTISTSNTSGTFQISWFVNALNWGQTTGARVSNNSNGFNPPSSSIDSAYATTRANGMVHFVSTGNNGASSIGYPSNLSSVNAVGNVNRFGNRAASSNYGTGLEFMAPGESIYTTDRTGSNGYENGDYATVSGTSFSSPYSAGVAALIISQNPNFTPAEIENRMTATCTDMGPAGYDTGHGYGLVNAHRALTSGGGGGQELLTNGGFELGYADWSASGSTQVQQGAYPRTGTWYAFLGNADNTLGVLAHNYFTIPSSAAAATLSFWLNIVTQETSVGPYDTLIVNLVDGAGNAHRLATYSEADSGSNTNGDYSRRSFDVSAYRGQSVQVQFVGSTDVTLPTIFRIDDVSLVAGTSGLAADFNHDGNVDLVWQNNSTGQHSLWLMNGTVWNGSQATLLTIPAAQGWQIAGTGDFNRDGNVDIVWENTSTGQHTIWLMNGTVWNGSQASLLTIPPAQGWRIASTGDFNHDGNVDIVWENTSTGQHSIWLMNGTVWNGSQATLLTIPPAQGWRIATTGDFNHDGNVDIVWENTSTGQHSIWLMNGTVWNGSQATLLTIPAAQGWRIAGTGDFNHDGNVDIVWRNISTGQHSIWLMNGTVWNGSQATLLTIPPAQGWEIRNH